MEDERYIRRAISLARKGAGRVSPNPMVGAVIVKNGKIIGEGWHKRFGGPHAEIEALQSCGKTAADATLYVTLEPCCHYGKTPPCTLAVISSGICKVIISNLDPNPLVAGKGVAELRRAGISVATGICKREGEELNRFFFKHITTGMPYVTLKSAQTLDGRVADLKGNSKWITGEPARRMVHTLRGKYDAVLTGIGTVLADNPLLTARMVNGRNPIKVVLDTRLRIPLTAQVLTNESAKAIIVCSADASAHKMIALRKLGATVLPVRTNRRNPLLKTVLKKLGAMGIGSVLVEGGGGVFSSFLTEQCFDEVITCTAPLLLGSGTATFSASGYLLATAPRLRLSGCNVLGEDVISIYRKT